VDGEQTAGYRGETGGWEELQHRGMERQSRAGGFLGDVVPALFGGVAAREKGVREFPQQGVGSAGCVQRLRRGQCDAVFESESGNDLAAIVRRDGGGTTAMESRYVGARDHQSSDDVPDR